MDRQATINYLTANCDCWKSKGDRETLNALPDDKLEELEQYERKQSLAVQVANAAVRGFTQGDTAFRINPKTGNWEKAKVTANAPVYAGPDEEEEDDDGDDAAVAAETKRRMRGKKVMAPPEESVVGRRVQTFDDLVRAAPVEVQNRLSQLADIERQKKDEIIQRLLVNVSPAERRAQYDRLVVKPLDELAQFAQLMPPQTNSAEIEQPRQVRNRKAVSRRHEVDDDVLALPSSPWETVENDDQVHQPEPIDSQDVDEIDDDSNLTPRQRQAFNDASAITENEKRKLIDRMVENAGIQDDELETKLRSNLMTKSLNELQLVQALSPRRDNRPPPNYFGQSAAPLGNVRQAAVNAEEDVLPLPITDWRQQA